MKLSMWMIANRLSAFDLDLNIDENAPAILNSARRAYATNCVHIYQERDTDNVICDGEGDTIRIRNMNETQAFEIVQGVFDYYEDWLDSILKEIQKRNYQNVVNLAWQVFHNPMVLFDGNTKVLGITRQYPEDSIDREWAYLMKYGYTSLNAVQQMKYQYGKIDFTRHGSQDFRFQGDPLMAFGGISYCLYFNEVLCGRITLLSKDRPFNAGDYQLLETLSHLLEPRLGQLYLSAPENSCNVFYNVLFDKPYNENKLKIQLNYQQWAMDDIYYISLVELDFHAASPTSNLDSLMHIISQYFSNCTVLKCSPYILILSNHALHETKDAREFLQSLAKSNPIKIGFSLGCHGISKANALVPQAKSALYYGSLTNPTSAFYRFFDYAIDYIIDSDSIDTSIMACMGPVVELWEQQKATGDEMFHTLKCYLDNERSVTKTSTALYTHRNTILYRLKKIQEFLQCDLDDVYVRDYCRISIRTLELYDKKHPQ